MGVGCLCYWVPFLLCFALSIRSLLVCYKHVFSCTSLVSGTLSVEVFLSRVVHRCCMSRSVILISSTVFTD